MFRGPSKFKCLISALDGYNKWTLCFYVSSDQDLRKSTA